MARPETGASAPTEASGQETFRARGKAPTASSTRRDRRRVRTVDVAEEFGPVLVGRAGGAAMRRAIEATAASSIVVVDLEGVRMMSGSFADQLFGAIDRALLADGSVRFERVPPSIARLAWFVRDRREHLGQ